MENKTIKAQTSEYFGTEYCFKLHVTVVIITLLSADPIINKTLGLRPSLQENISRWKQTLLSFFS